MPEIIRTADYQAMSRRAANILSAHVTLKPNSVLGLATGSSPLGIYAQIIEWYHKGDLDFSRVTTINLDEYQGIEPIQSQSYHAYMNRNLFDHVNIPPAQRHLPDGLAADPVAECARYDEIIAQSGGIDVQLLGLGHNGHIAFNEPGASFAQGTHLVELAGSTRRANQRDFHNREEVPSHAYTVGIRSIMQAKHIVLVVSGAEKAEILSRAFLGPVTPNVPASVLQLHNRVTLVADAAALKYMV